MPFETLVRLWEIASKESKISGEKADFVFDAIGLFLVKPPTRKTYIPTPSNTACFAETRGDGVHFNFLLVDGQIAENSPVVMTVPMNFENENIIVGENLLDFLSLGSQVGYFSLEQFSYNWKETVLYYSDSNNYFENGTIKHRLMALLINEFNLQPWEEIDHRLQQLQVRYKSLLKFELKGDVI